MNMKFSFALLVFHFVQVLRANSEVEAEGVFDTGLKYINADVNILLESLRGIKTFKENSNTTILNTPESTTPAETITTGSSKSTSTTTITSTAQTTESGETTESTALTTTFSTTSTLSTTTLVTTTTPPTTTSPTTTTTTTTTTTRTTTTTPPTTTTIPTTTSVPTLALSGDVPFLTWNPNTDGTDFVVIETDPGCKLVVVIEKCNINGTLGEYAVISTNEDLTGNDSLLFIYNVDSKPAYLFNINILYASFSGTSASVFVANFSRIGERLTTVSTKEPTTTIILPTPSSNDTYEYTVYLAGKKAAQYKKSTLQRNLKNMILGMASEYCETQNFDLAVSLTINNIILVEIVQCPMNWPNYQTCVSLTFAVPIELNQQSNSVWSGYQLTGEHLKIMWKTYAEKYLTDGVRIYSPPDSTAFLRLQLIVFTTVTIIFVICLIAIRQISLWLSKRMIRRRMSDTASIMSADQRQSELSLPPHYLQETPPLFDNAYTMYNLDNVSVLDPSLSNPFGLPDFSELGTETKDDDSSSEEGPLDES